MGYDNFGLKIGVEGEREFKNSIREINSLFKILKSEMNLVTSAFKGNASSMESLKSKSSILKREIESQKEKIQQQNVVHFRIPFKPELGIELIPGTHKSWDLPEEEETRLAENGRTPSDSLERGKIIPLDRGDLLAFSANMIHRGLYGRNRFSFDIIFCDDTPDFKDFIDPKNQPDQQEIQVLNSELFHVR